MGGVSGGSHGRRNCGMVGWWGNGWCNWVVGRGWEDGGGVVGCGVREWRGWEGVAGAGVRGGGSNGDFRDQPCRSSRRSCEYSVEL